MSDAAPENSHVIAVGIECYEAGPSWNLDARQATPFVSWNTLDGATFRNRTFKPTSHPA
jgi:hypothetical protein